MANKFSKDADIILERKAKREGKTVDEMLWDRSGRDMVREEVFTLTGTMVDQKTIPAGIMAAIAAEDAK